MSGLVARVCDLQEANVKPTDVAPVMQEMRSLLQSLVRDRATLVGDLKALLDLPTAELVPSWSKEVSPSLDESRNLFRSVVDCQGQQAKELEKMSGAVAKTSDVAVLQEAIGRLQDRVNAVKVSHERSADDTAPPLEPPGVLVVNRGGLCPTPPNADEILAPIFEELRESRAEICKAVQESSAMVRKAVDFTPMYWEMHKYMSLILDSVRAGSGPLERAVHQSTAAVIEAIAESKPRRSAAKARRADAAKIADAVGERPTSRPSSVPPLRLSSLRAPSA
mmetsp:Transcript_19438/g.55704  ORF Transcript_19438/g.55704 Transcript_19438/m.55704 type:complete len:279 (+) Transcript_19438:17-853(+)